jgi:hypothetical protein
MKHAKHQLIPVTPDTIVPNCHKKIVRPNRYCTAYCSSPYGGETLDVPDRIQVSGKENLN